MDRRQLTNLCDDLRLAGIEAIIRPWGKSETWTCIQVGRIELLWTPDGEYDGWATAVSDTPEDQKMAESIVEEFRRQQERRFPKQRDAEQ